jgi:plasmid stabilization system protein ParE
MQIINNPNILVSQAAINDLEFIWRDVFYESSKNEADAVYTQLITSFRNIQSDFTIGTSMESVRDGYRKLETADFRVYYRADRDDVLEVVRVLGK